MEHYAAQTPVSPVSPIVFELLDLILSLNSSIKATFLQDSYNAVSSFDPQVMHFQSSHACQCLLVVISEDWHQKYMVRLDLF